MRLYLSETERIQLLCILEDVYEITHGNPCEPHKEDRLKHIIEKLGGTVE